MSRRRGTSTLHQAVRDHDTPAIERLVDDGAGVDNRDAQGFTPLLLAALLGDVAAVAVLLRRGADPNATLPDGDSGLLLAARGGFVDVIDRLVEGGTDVAAHGGAALAKALWNDQDAAMQKLLDFGAPANHVDPETGTTLLEAALMRKMLRWVEPLLAAGAGADGAGFTRPLTHAVLQNQPEIVNALLAVGADPGVRNEYGDTPMHAAGSEGRVAMAALLFAAGATLEPEDKRARRTPLHEAALAGRTDMVAWLLAHGVDVHRTDAERKNALTLARMGLHDETAASLLGAGAREQPEHADDIADGRREATEERARRDAEAAKEAAFAGRPGLVTGGAFHGMRGKAQPVAEGRFEARVNVFGRTVTVTLEAGQFAFEEG